EQPVGDLVVQPRPLEVEEEQLRLDRRALLLDALQERAVLGRGRVDREREMREGAGLRRDLLDRAELLHGLDEPRLSKSGELAGQALGEYVGALLSLAHQPVDPRPWVRAVTVQEVGEVPGDLLQVGVSNGLGGAHPPKTRTAAARRRSRRASRRSR